MRTWPILGVLIVVGLGLVRPALGHEWKDEFRDGPCQDGVGDRWQGEWKQEFRDGPCQVKIEAKRSEYKEEVKCDRAQ